MSGRRWVTKNDFYVTSNSISWLHGCVPATAYFLASTFLSMQTFFMLIQIAFDSVKNNRAPVLRHLAQGFLLNENNFAYKYQLSNLSI